MNELAERSRKDAIQGRQNIEAQRIASMVEHMSENKAYIHAANAAGGDPDGAILRRLQDRFRWYRQSWKGFPRQAVAERLIGPAFVAAGVPPLCIDVEVAAVCDLACPFCYRQHLATPDKIIDDDLCYAIIDQAAELGVPSMKFNWRGEPLLHPKLSDFIAYAKKCGILETIINTNATTLTEKKARQLIEAGLDLMIYSFDGGTKQSYEKMRPGRFADNSFDDVYGNIKKFQEVRTRMGARFPRTKIQMILTDTSFDEQDSFYALFDDIVDDVATKQYTERGAGMDDLDDATRNKLQAYFDRENLPSDTAYLRDMSGDLFVAQGRLACEQPFQRLLVTYDGKVSMCCYDWGARHPVGYVGSQSFGDWAEEYRTVHERAKRGAKGFELLAGIEVPKRVNDPIEQVESLADIWRGKEVDVVRSAHVNKCADNLEICRNCTFKETYDWHRVN